MVTGGHGEPCRVAERQPLEDHHRGDVQHAHRREIDGEEDDRALGLGSVGRSDLGSQITAQERLDHGGGVTGRSGGPQFGDDRRADQRDYENVRAPAVEHLGLESEATLVADQTVEIDAPKVVGQLHVERRRRRIRVLQIGLLGGFLAINLAGPAVESPLAPRPLA